MLSAGGEVLDVQEPLNVQNRQTILRHRAKHWYSYISAANEREYLPWYRDALEYRIHPVHDIRRARLVSPRDPFRTIEKWTRVTRARRKGQRILFKDPFAVFSAPWFISRLHCRAVISIRHPAAVVSSLKKLGYTFDFRDLLEQDTLMRDHLGPYRAEMQAARENPDTTFDADCGAVFGAGGDGLGDYRSGGGAYADSTQATHRYGENGVHANGLRLAIAERKG
jgi:hypothetical protein